MASSLVSSPRQQPALRSRGGQREYTEERVLIILERLEVGDGLNTICQDPGMPSPGAVRNWYTDDYMGFAGRYVRARNLGLDARAEHLRIVAADQTRDANCRRIEIDTERWLLAKLRPDVYGDRTQIDHTLRWDGDVAKLDEGQLARLIVTLEQVAAGQQAAQQAALNAAGEAQALVVDVASEPVEPEE